MTDVARKKILLRGAIIIYGTILLAAGQSFYLEIVTTDYAHEIFSHYFTMETGILGVMIVLGLKNKWTRIILVLVTICEAALFLHDGPISPDELLMIIIFGLRVYVIAGLFNSTINGYYKADN